MKFAYEKKTGKIIWRYWLDNEKAGSRFDARDGIGVQKESDFSQDSLRDMFHNAKDMANEDERGILVYDAETGKISPDTEIVTDD